MLRIIEILKEFITNQNSVAQSLLVDKLKLSVKTINKLIIAINEILTKESNCKVIKFNNYFYLVGYKKETVVECLLFTLNKSSNHKLVFNLLLLLLNNFWQKQKWIKTELKNKLGLSEHQLKLVIMELNQHFLDNNIALQFSKITKNEWSLNGDEFELCLILVLFCLKAEQMSQSPNTKVDQNIKFLFTKVNKQLVEYKIAVSYFELLVSCLVVLIRTNKIKNKWFNYWLLAKRNLLSDEINHNSNLITNLLKNEFSISINKKNKKFLNWALIISSQKKCDLDNSKIINVINEVNRNINEVYKIKIAIMLLNDSLSFFLEKYWHQLFYNYFNLFFENNELIVSNLIVYDPLTWEIFVIIKNSLWQKRIKFLILHPKNFYLLKTINYLVKKNENRIWTFTICFLQPENIRLIQKFNEIVFFIKSEYPLIAFKIVTTNEYNNLYHSFFNISNILFIHHQDAKQHNLSNNLIKCSWLPNDTFNNLNDKILSAVNCLKNKGIKENISFYYLSSSFNFNSLNSLLWYFSCYLKRKFTINDNYFDLANAFVSNEFIMNKIILIHKLISYNNYAPPIILIYLKKTIPAKKNCSIQIIIILLSVSSNLSQFDLVNSWCEKWVFKKTNFLINSLKTWKNFILSS